MFQVGSEWPSSGYKQIERGLLLDFGFNSAPSVIMFIFVGYSGQKVVTYLVVCMFASCRAYPRTDFHEAHFSNNGKIAKSDLLHHGHLSIYPYVCLSGTARLPLDRFS